MQGNQKPGGSFPVVQDFGIIEIGKIPPQAIDLEEAIIGACLLEPEALDEISLILQPEAFYKDVHQKIFKVMLEMFRADQRVDILTVTEQMKRRNMLEEIGGPLYITQLSGKVATAGHIADHARIVLQKFIQREIIRISSQMTRQAYDDTVDPDDIITENYLFLEQIHEAVYAGRLQKSFYQIMQKSISDYVIREQQAKEGIVPGINTPIVSLDNITGGWLPTDLIILAGRPGMGKTAFALSSIKKAAELHKWVNVFSLEMSDVRLVDRMLVGEAGVDAQKFRDGMLGQDEWKKIEDAVHTMSAYNVLIDPTPVVRMDYILSKCRVNKRKEQCDMIVIDYLQLIHEPGTKGNREQEVSEVSRRAKLIAKELEVPVLMLAQLNRFVELRAGKDKRPILSDLRESGAIEQDADTVIFLYRPEAYGIYESDQGEKTIGRGECIIAKQRNGKVGTVFFGYSPDMTRIFDYVKPDQVPAADQFIEPVDPQEEMPF